MRIQRQNETQEQTQTRRQRDNAWHRASREAETAQQRQDRLTREAQSRRKKQLTLQNAAIDYDPSIDLSTIKDLQIGRMTKVCQHC